MPYYLMQKGIHEIIVVDDGSLDDTEPYVRELSARHPKVRYFKHDTRRGTPAARNTGIDHLSSNSQYVLYGEDDLVFDQNYALRLMGKTESIGCDIVGGRVLSIKTGETHRECTRRHDQYLINLRRHAHYPDLIDERTLVGNWILTTTEPALFLHACSLFRRRVLESVRFDENYRWNYFREETDMYLSARMKGFRIVFAGDTVGFHMQKGTGGTADHGFPLGDKLSTALEKVGFPYHIYSVLNNNYFLDKYYDYLKKELGYLHDKDYYKRFFALMTLKGTMRYATAFLQRWLHSADEPYSADSSN
jgi:glycosyltransferase involved in cell wall biosynthesis